MNYEEEIKRAINTGKVIVGTKRTEEAILLENPKFVFFVSDLKELDKERLMYLLKIGKIPYKELNHTYKDFGELIGKDFPVGAIAVLDAGKSKIK